MELEYSTLEQYIRIWEVLWEKENIEQGRRIERARNGVQIPTATRMVIR